MAALNPVEERLQQLALEATQSDSAPADERQLAACILAMCRELAGYRSLGLGTDERNAIEAGKVYEPRHMYHGIAE